MFSCKLPHIPQVNAVMGIMHMVDVCLYFFCLGAHLKNLKLEICVRSYKYFPKMYIYVKGLLLHQNIKE